MSLLNTNKLTWFENDGAPLVLGYVYVGQSGLDPQVPANQKTVTFTDSQGNSFTAAQPLRTNEDGRMQWNGKAIEATVDGDYSLLILDSNKKEINGGWIKTVSASESGGSGDLENYREYGLVLGDVKKIDVSVGETVASIGKDLASDGLGANWLVVSPTGSVANDETIIDFDNGLQGVLVSNQQAKYPNYTGYNKTTVKYTLDGESSRPQLIVEGNIANDGSTVSVGPTGSGADVIWPALDAIPENAKLLSCTTNFAVFNGTRTFTGQTFGVRNFGSTESWGSWDTVVAFGIAIDSVNVNSMESNQYIEIPILDSANRFECRFFGTPDQDFGRIYLKGFEV